MGTKTLSDGTTITTFQQTIGTVKLARIFKRQNTTGIAEWKALRELAQEIDLSMNGDGTFLKLCGFEA